MDFNKTMPLRPPKPAAKKEEAKEQPQVEPTLPIGKEQPAPKTPTTAKPAAPAPREQPAQPAPQPVAKEQPKATLAKESPKPTAPAPKEQPVPTTSFEPETAADAWLGLLAARGVEYLFANGGTDFAPVVEAYAKGQKLGWKLPQVVIVPHENMGVAMAHGYTMVTGRPQAMMVHVGVGTANALNGLINASRQNIPLLFTAGRTPITESGALPVARNNYIHWAQEHFDQGGMLREFMKWDYELRHAEQVETVIDRGLAIAKSEPQGPVYVTLPREVLASPFAKDYSATPTMVAATPPAADSAMLEVAAKLLGNAQHPLLITANGGRTAESSYAIERLAHAL